MFSGALAACACTSLVLAAKRMGGDICAGSDDDRSAVELLPPDVIRRLIVSCICACADAAKRVCVCKTLRAVNKTWRRVCDGDDDASHTNANGGRNRSFSAFVLYRMLLRERTARARRRKQLECMMIDSRIGGKTRDEADSRLELKVRAKLALDRNKTSDESLDMFLERLAYEIRGCVGLWTLHLANLPSSYSESLKRPPPRSGLPSGKWQLGYKVVRK